jgi:hypothetical protein
LSSKMGDAFTTVAAQRGVDFAEDTAGALEACKEGVRGYFRVDLPDGTTMVHMIRERGGFNLQFGRLDSCDSSSMSSVLTSSTERLLPKCLEWRRGCCRVQDCFRPIRPIHVNSGPQFHMVDALVNAVYYIRAA